MGSKYFYEYWQKIKKHKIYNLGEKIPKNSSNMGYIIKTKKKVVQFGAP